MTSDRTQESVTGPILVDEPHKLDLRRLEAWMAANIPGFGGPLRYTQFAGGQSNPTYRLDSPAGPYVLRRKPFGKLLSSAHAVDREYRVITALHSLGFPVPQAYGLCEDPDVIGAAFYIMELVEGRTLWDGALPGMTPTERRHHYEVMIDALAALHNADYVAGGLADFGREGNYFERQVARWTRQYRMSQTELLPEIEQLITWLPTTIPEQTRTSLVHGDYRIDNMIFAPDRAQVLAVLDWELSTLGDPLADFSYLLMNWVTEPNGRAGIRGLTGSKSGIPTLEDAMARYCAATGRTVLPNLSWYFAYNLFRLAGIVQGIRKRAADGISLNISERQAAADVGRFAQAAWKFAREAGA